MVDRYPGRIQIGGTLSARKLNNLVRTVAITDPEIEMNWSFGEDVFLTGEKLQNWLATRSEPRTLDLHAGELPDGSFHPLEQWLRDHELSYRRHSDSYCDIDAEIVLFIKGNSTRYDANNEGDIMLPAHCVRRVYDVLRQGRIFDAMEALSELVPIVDEIPPFMVKYPGGRIR